MKYEDKIKAIPLPFFYGALFWLFKGKYGCECKKGFWKYKSYVTHYEEKH